MKWEFERNSDKESRLAKWRPWFAWYPVRITYTKDKNNSYDSDTNKWVWLETVERTTQMAHGYYFNYYRER